jgi:hypothetical protein
MTRKLCNSVPNIPGVKEETSRDTGEHSDLGENENRVIKVWEKELSSAGEMHSTQCSC